ncbi:DUF6383 domain-containing protein [uncultured Parabacteroides sp.]|uniref:DUF6383 domain-containing protein n=1 Tax=uncultured Parabacteroides sp. TaxID=512312 RepID=UPI002803E8C3|nr:DUF6383 domain-containing protein [uncultured Parabacteroides sp.]
MATALVAGGLSANVMATPVDASTLKDGQTIHLTIGSSTDYLAMDEAGNFSKVAASSWDGKIKDLFGTLWQIKLIPHATAGGTTYTYSFTNRLSGQMLSVKLQSDKKDGGRVNTIAANEKGGNTEWAWDGTKGLYVIGTDSAFTIGSNTNGKLTFNVEKGSVAPAATTNALLKGDVSATPVTLTATDFNTLVAKEAGRLFFTDENVSSTETNVLTANKWKAIDGHIANDGAAFAASSGKDVLYLTNGKEYENRLNVAMDAANETQKEYLLVDYSFYDPSKEFNVLKVDTIAAEPKVKVVDFSDRTKIAKHHPATAAFTVTYFIPNDSMVIAPAFVQTSIPVATTLDAMHAALPATTNTTTELTEAQNKVGFVKAAVAIFAGKANADTFTEGLNFAEVEKFTAADGSFNASGVSGQTLIDNAITAINAIKAADAKKDDIKAYIAAAKAYLNSLKGLTITKAGTKDSKDALVSTSAIKNGENYVDGLSPLEVTAVNPDKQVVIRKLSNTKVLTIGEITSATETNGNLIATIKTSDKDATIGGDATIAEGLYYVINAMKEDEGVANKFYGLYYDFSPVNPAKYVAKTQAFNPFAQFVVSKAAGVDKGNYTIENRATADAEWQGVTNVVDKDNNIFAIGGDTIQLVAAEDVDADNAYIGYKYITANDAKNNKFTITSAADVLEGQSIVMTKDSTLKVATPEGEVLYTLVPSAEEEYGVEDALAKVTYTIMDADSAFIIKNAAGQYVFSNGKYATKNGTPVQFTMIAVDADSTFVLYDAQEDPEDSRKLVVSTQYKTISGEGLDARNDMFIVKPQSAPASYKSLPKHVRIQAINGDYAAVNAANQGIAVREGDLKADAYSNLDFIFWLDTAHYDNAAPYTYYITKGVKATEEVAASRLYMWNSVDSAAAKDANKELPYIYGTGANRVMFRTASIMAQDTLLVPALDAAAKIDTVSVAAGKSADGLKHAVKAGVKNFQFSFEFASKDAEGEYNIVCQNANGKNYVHNINGVLAMGPKEDAVVVNVLEVSADDVVATDNETIATSEVAVIAGEGQVTIANAAGKKVVISNILGQVVANTVIASDNAVIAAPQGVVVVAVEGEEAVKAIVK